MSTAARLVRTIRKPVLITLLVGLNLLLISAGQETPGVGLPAEGPRKQAGVAADGKVLFYVRGISSFPAEERAERISRKIIRVARDRSIPVDSLKITARGEHQYIYAGKELIMLVSADDAELDGINPALLAGIFKEKIRTAILSYRQDRSSAALMKYSIYGILALAVYVALLILILRLANRIKRWLETRIRAMIESMEDKSYRLIRSVQLWNAIRILLRTIIIAVILVLTFLFVEYILGLFPFTRGIASYIYTLFLEPLRSLGKGIVNFLPSLAFLIVIFFVTRYLLRLVRLFFTGIREGGIKLQKFDDDWAMPTYKIVRLVVIIFALVVAYPYIPGSETNAFKGLSVFLGILLSLGSSSFISNIIAGYSMTYRGAFKKGDLIRIDEHTGYVEEQRLLVTRLRSRKNEEISIPNSVLLNSTIINYSKRAKDLGLILHTTVGIGYETPWRLVDAMLKEAASRSEGILKEPPPFVLKESLGDFAVSYEINAYCDDASRMKEYYSVLHQNILDVFNENNVQIMTPAYEGDPETPKVVPKEQWNMTLATDR